MRKGGGRSEQKSGAAGVAGTLALILLMIAGGAALDAGCAAAADAPYGAYLAAECAACHRRDAAHGAIPPLHVLTYDRLVAALKAYRDGTRANAVMQSVARSLGDAEIEALAAYFARQS